jgi:hypothetical protein
MFKLFGGNKKKESYFLELKEDNAPELKPVKEVPVVQKESKKVVAEAPKKVAPKVAEEPKKVTPKVAVAKKEVAETLAIVETMPRRLPGPSLNQFKDMARKIQKF